MSSYQQSLRFLYGLQNRGMKFGLRNTKALLKSVGNPHLKFPSIHIAGTNGKGSTASFLASVFIEGGYKTALYTSPHLVRFTERIRIDGVEMQEDRLVEYVKRLRASVENLQATFFEATTCIAFQYFADEHVEIAVVEAGLGGRLDSTNVLMPLVSIVTSIALDHEKYLGGTLAKIAREKAGVVKRGVPCILNAPNANILSVFRKTADRKETRVIQASKHISVRAVSRGLGRPWVSLQGKFLSVQNVKLGLSGSHQVSNSVTAFSALDILLSRKANQERFRRIHNDVVARGFRNVAENTNLQGRLSNIVGDNRFIFDVAHNPDGVAKLSQSLSKNLRKHLIVIFGVMKDKNYLPMCQEVATFGKLVIAVQPKGSRALSSSTIVRIIRQLGGTATNGGTVRKGIRIAKTRAVGGSKILVVGSNYVVGEALESLA